MNDALSAIKELKRDGLWGALSFEIANFLGDEISKTGKYMEWGAGSSTRLVSRLNIEWARCIETDRFWIEQLKKDEKINEATNSGRLEIRHIDLGPTKQWGYPINPVSRFTSRSYHLSQVVEASIELNGEPVVIFIDGRFRIACALACFGLMPKGSVVLVDDYANRNSYHVLEKVCDLESMIGRAAKFLVGNATSSWATYFQEFEMSPQ
jgi:hypothetical protein